MRIAGIVFLGVVLAWAPRAGAFAKADEGFASMVVSDGTSVEPRNRITHATAGDDVVYWIKWKDPLPRATLRCVITGPDNTHIDEREELPEQDAGGFSTCAMETESSDAGVFRFTQYLDGEVVGEATFTLDSPSFFGTMTRRKQGKYILAAAGLLVFGIYWARRWMTGDKRSIKQLVRGENGAEMAVAIAVATKGAASGLPVRPVLKPSKVEPPPEAPPGSPAEAAWKTAKAARKAGDVAAAVAAVRGFDKAYPGHELVPEVYLFSAQMMANELENPDMARKIAQHILAKYPGHFVAPEAKRLLAALPAPAG